MDKRTPGEIEIDAAERASAASKNTLGHIEEFLKNLDSNDLYLHTLGRVQLLTETLIGKVAAVPSPNPIIELAEICAELLSAIEIIGQDMPRVQAILIPLSSRINILRYPE